MSTHWNHTPAGNQFAADPFSVEQWVVDIFDNPEGVKSTTVLPSGQESIGIYPVVQVNPTPPGNYYRAAAVPYVLSLSGAAYAAGTTVTQTFQWESWTIEEIYNRKRVEIGAQDDRVRYNAVDTALSANWWIIATEKARFEILGISTASNTRQINGQGWPSGPNAPWLGIYREDTGKARRVQVTSQATWDTLEAEIVQHDQACGNATDASVDALDTAYNDGNGNIEDVRNHDPADPAWGYPPTVELNSSAQALFG